MWSYEYIHHISPHNPQACHIFRLLPMYLAYFQAKVKSEFAYSRLPRNSQLLWCPHFFTPTSVLLWVSLGPWSYLHLINWVEVETGLWRRISNPWSLSLFFVFQMHDVCKSLFPVAHLIEGFLLPYTQTCCHILYHDDRNNCKGKASDGSGYTINNLVRAGLCEKVYWKGLLKYERKSYQNRGYHSMWDQVCMLKGISGFNLFILRIIWGHRNEKAG